MNGTVTKLTFGLLFLLSVRLLQAQDENDSKIHVKVTKEENGETKVFEGEYDNERQMMSDPDYMKFMGTEFKAPIPFHEPNPGIHRFQNGFAFSFEDSSDFSYSFDLDTLLDLEDIKISKELEEELGLMHEKMRGHDLRIAHGFSGHLSDSAMVEFEHHSAFVHRLPHFSPPPYPQADPLKTLEIGQIESDELGKKGIVKDSEQLSLEKFDYYPNPSKGNFRLTFKVPNQGSLSVKVYNLDGKEVFVRSFDQFGGYFSEHIDLSAQAEGMYLLEIKLDKKRLTRKVLIE